MTWSAPIERTRSIFVVLQTPVTPAGALERGIGRLRREVALAGTHVFGERTFTPAEHLVTRSELRHVLADRLDLPGDVRPPNRLLRYAQPVPRHADDEGTGPHDVPVLWIG
jgi:hypothetical protein